MAYVREMDANLMLPPRARHNAEEREVAASTPACDMGIQPKLGPRRSAIGSHTILDGDPTLFVFTERCIDYAIGFADVPVNNRQIFFLNRSAFPNLAQFPGGFRILCQDNDAARFAVQPIHQMRSGFLAQIQSHTPDEARVFVGFGRVANQARGFIHHEQIRVLMYNAEELFHFPGRNAGMQVVKQTELTREPKAYNERNFDLITIISASTDALPASHKQNF